jgi:hypothetical protein
VTVRGEGDTMTPEDRADKIIPPGCGVSNDDENLDFMRQEIAAAIHAAVAEEREACAARVEAAALRWPDEPQIAAVLRREADAIRARGRNGGAGA